MKKVKVKVKTDFLTLTKKIKSILRRSSVPKAETDSGGPIRGFKDIISPGYVYSVAKSKGKPYAIDVSLHSKKSKQVNEWVKELKKDFKAGGVLAEWSKRNNEFTWDI